MGVLPTPGQFRVHLDPDQINPTNTVFGQDVTTGTFTIDELDQTADGTFVAHYSFRQGNKLGAVMTGSGVGRWKGVDIFAGAAGVRSSQTLMRLA